MKKVTILFSFLFAISAFSFAETHIPAGPVSGNWAFNNSPYIIDGTIYIHLDSSLTIEPGVQVLFFGHDEFNIYGRLLAQGTATDTIVFSAQDTTAGWHGLRFWNTNSNGQDSSKIVYCKLEYGKATGGGYEKYGGAIYCNNSSPGLAYVTITGNSANNGGGIYCHHNSNPILENVTITGNSATGLNSYGGGIYFYKSSPSLSNVTITGNIANSNGGGIYCNISSPILENCTITGNSASVRGGGIYCDESNPILENVTITGNSVSDRGGGIYCYESNPILENVTITGNSANLGGGIYCDESSPNLAHVTITGNSAEYGGGILCMVNSNPGLANVTVTGNSAEYGGGILCMLNSNPSLAYVTVTGNSANDEGGGIYFSNSSPSFDPVNRCNIFLNYASVGNDLFVNNCPVIDVIVDTFTVLQPNDYFAYPIDNFAFNILNGKVEQENQDLYVSPIGSDNNSGLTPDDPLLTISYALVKIIANSTNPHTIYLSNGTYSPSLTGEIFPLICRSYVSLQGEDEDSTILDGEGISRILYCDNVNNFSIENLTIQNGSAESGGGIYSNESSPDLENVTITNNSAADYGGGIFCNGSSPDLENVAITNNSAFDDGGGIFCYNNSSPGLTNVTISSNSASDEGGGIYCRSNSYPGLLNCILWNDSPQEICFHSSFSPNSITISYSDIQGGVDSIVTNNNGTVNWLEGNIDTDPLFADPTNGNFNLTWANYPTPDTTKSPCIDAGDPNSPFDPDGTIADMGSFYYDQSQVTQQITFSQGFGFVSSRISPDNPDMMEVVAEIINDDLVYIRNSTGAMLRKIGTNWVNGIGDWIVTEGYLIKINAAGQFTIGGTLIPQDTPIEILAGFQFVSYLPPNEMDAIEAFSSIISDDLLYIRNSEGNMLRKIGPNWVNGIGNCIPTEGYLVKLSADATLIYPNTKKSNNITKTFPKHFIFENGNPAEAVYTLYLEGLEIGDEVAAFDGDKMVGATRINSQKDFENELPVFSTLINGQGYEAGNPITLKVWSENKIIPADFTIEAIYDSYVSDVYPDEDGKYSVVNITKGTIENTVETISVYPNPSTGVFNISIEGIIGDISIKVFDLRGKVFSNFELKGSISTQLDLTELATGVYFISFISKDCSKVRRIVIK